MKRKLLDKRCIIFLIIFYIISILCIKSASIYTSKSMGNLILKQSIWYLLGIVIIYVIYKCKNKNLYKYSFIFYFICLLLLFLLLFFGTVINNSRCWFRIPGIGSFQPSEFMKIAIILVLSSMTNKFHKDRSNPSIKDEFIFLIKTFIIILIPSILTFLEPDTGAVMMYLIIYVSILIISGLRARWFISFGVIFAILITTIFIIYIYYSKTFIKVFGTDFFYRFDRIFAWKNGSGLQLENSLTSISSSGLLGHGFNKTPLYFPEASTDFIFSVLASNFGFILTLVFIGILILFDRYIITLMKKNISLEDKIALTGISSCLIFQQIQNIGMTIGILPITGITLPFISYGGSSLISYMIMLGIILNAANSKNYSFKTT